MVYAKCAVSGMSLRKARSYLVTEANQPDFKEYFTDLEVSPMIGSRIHQTVYNPVSKLLE